MPPPASPEAGETPGRYTSPPTYRNIDEMPPRHLQNAGQESGEPLPVVRRQPPAATAREARNIHRQSHVEYDIPDAYANLDEVATSPVIRDPDDDPIQRYTSLEQIRAQEQEYARNEALRGRTPLAPGQASAPIASEKLIKGKISVSRLATQLCTISYLVLFSILGTLGRLGLQALTSYQGMPVIFPSIWPNFTGSFIIGFLAEDRMLFRLATHLPTRDNAPDRLGGDDQETDTPPFPAGVTTAKQEHSALKKTIPLYIGLATGFCGSLTSFSSFIRDLFFALSNDLSPTGPRNGGYSLIALLAVLITTVSLSLSALFLGAHLAFALDPLTPSLPSVFVRKYLDRFALPLALATWLASVLLSIFPPNPSWRGAATFSLAFAPIGCLARFYASLYLNGRFTGFPLGTFAINIAGTTILGMAWDLAHVPLGGVVGCQVLQGIQDGFCGSLTTVSTWVAELAALNRRQAYTYGVTSVGVAFGLLVAITGGLRWTARGVFGELLCNHTL